MANRNYIGTKWRNLRNRGIYTVVDQSEAAGGVPDVHENAMLTLEANPGTRPDPVNYQAFITVRAGAIARLFIEYRTLTGIDPDDSDIQPVDEKAEK